MSSFKITETPNVIHDHFLDIIGNDFKFDHAKGFAEWIKNSVDAYNREVNAEGSLRYADTDQFIYVWLRPKRELSPVTFVCVDFVGMAHDEIEKAFKTWGDPEAASRGKGKKFLGGHGNGGKFYMRQMFRESRFITYRNGKLNVFGFNAAKRYGFDKSYENRAMGLKRAFEIADIESIIPNLPAIVRKRLESGECGFTAVVGEAPERIKRKNAPKSIVQRLTVHPQARRLVARKQVWAKIDKAEPFRLGDGTTHATRRIRGTIRV